MGRFHSRFWSRTAAALLFGAGLAGAPALAQSPPLYVKTAAIRLPIQMDDAVRRNIAEVKLYVKSREGDWQCVGTAPSTERAFDYVAPGDGAYAFLFVLIDRYGKNYPSSLSQAQPQRVVVVDTKKPDVELKEIRAANGDALIQATMIDANPDPTGLGVSAGNSDGSWTRLEPVGGSNNLFSAAGRSGPGTVYRVTARDLAGNGSMKDMTVGAKAASSGIDMPVSVRDGNALELPLAKVKVQEMKAPALSLPEMPQPVLPTRDTELRPAAFETRDVQQPAWPKPLPMPSVMPEMPLTSEMVDDLTNQLAKRPSPLEVNPSIALKDEAKFQFPKEAMVPAVPPRVELPELPNLPEPSKLVQAPGLLSPAVTEMPKIPEIGSLETPAIQQASAKMAVGEPELPLIRIASNICELDYLAENRSDAKADYWLTNDGGKTWKPMANEAQPGRGLRFRLPDEGRFGIRIRPQGGAKAPAAGERPDCMIEVKLPSPAASPSLILPGG